MELLSWTPGSLWESAQLVKLKSQLKKQNMLGKGQRPKSPTQMTACESDA